MWDRMEDPRDTRNFMNFVAREISMLRDEVNKVLREVREAEFVRERMNRERPGYWEDSVKLEYVRRKFEKAR